MTQGIKEAAIIWGGKLSHIVRVLSAPTSLISQTMQFINNSKFMFQNIHTDKGK